MSTLRIDGGVPLRGEVEVSGAKNAALPILAACLLTNEHVRLTGVPRTTDIMTMVDLLTDLGMKVNWVGDHVLDLDLKDGRPCSVPDEYVRAMRASISVLGPLLARRGSAHIAKPGGCRIGARPIDVHLKGLRALGAKIVETDRATTGSAKRLDGCEVDLRVPSGSTVLGTANVLCAAVLAAGRTVLLNAAQEPEICELALFLNSMGARVSGIGTGCLVVDGVRSLRGAEHAIIPDRIEAGTFLAAAAITGGDVLVRNARPADLGAVTTALSGMGVSLVQERDGIRARREEVLRPTDVVTEPFPGFPTDMQAQVMAMMCLAPGTSSVTERVFPERFGHAREFQKMGADIRQHGSRAEVVGVGHLRGAEVRASDLRAGAALVLAGLAARGTTIVRGAELIARGYDAMVDKLTRLGARVEVVSDP